VSEVLAVDVGATSIRMGRYNENGVMLAARSRRRTPYPCTPERLVTIVAERAARTDATVISLGFPGEVEDGVVLDAANLTRPGGLVTQMDEDLARRWRRFELDSNLEKATGCRVVVDNDAAMAARGTISGHGVELVVTLGTGCGLALARDGELVRVRDVGNEHLRGSATYDEVLGELGRRQGEEQWLVHVVATVNELASEFGATTVHLAGGNARRISPHAFGALAPHVHIARDDAALRGAFLASYR
jgi:polyphosphate glucokinase